jgi:hypothetical protein
MSFVFNQEMHVADTYQYSKTYGPSNYVYNYQKDHDGECLEWNLPHKFRGHHPMQLSQRARCPLEEKRSHSDNISRLSPWYFWLSIHLSKTEITSEQVYNRGT